MQGTKTRLLNNIKHMKESVYKKLDIEAGKCSQTYSGEHEWMFKWELPDRECYVCKKCGKEEIIFK